MQYFVVMIDYGRKGREAVVDPELTRREVVSRIASGEYKDISFIHRIEGCLVEDVTEELKAAAQNLRAARSEGQRLEAVGE